MTEHYTAESVYKTFQDIDNGLYTNAHFSHADVVMVSKDHYSALMEAWELMQEQKEENERPN